MYSAFNGIFLILLICFVLVNVIVIVGGVVWAICKALKMNDKKGLRAVIFSILCILVAACSWIFNFGWLRFILTFMLVPFIHAIIFFITNTCASKYIDRSKKMKVYVWLFYITYLCAYVTLPDGADIGPTYMFFGLIKSDSASSIGFLVAYISCMIHIIAFILQSVQILKLKKKEKTEAIQEATETEI